jgi:HEPN domain-containing protein
MARYDEWIKRAISSLELAQAKNIPHIYYEDLCFQLQQSAEKALKGLLIYYGVEPEFTHNISKLITNLEEHIEIPNNVRKSIDLTNYAIQTRYPGEYTDITRKEYEESLEIAKECLDWVESKIGENIKENGI